MTFEPEAAEGVPLWFAEDAAVIVSGDPLTLNVVTAQFARGDSLMLTAENLALNSDRHGNCSLLMDDLEQVERWGRVRWWLGDWPDSEPRVLRGSEEQLKQADRLRQHAYANLDGPELHQELARITREVGWSSQAQHSRTLRHSTGDRPRSAA